jgi:hypothetical protein
MRAENRCALFLIPAQAWSGMRAENRCALFLIPLYRLPSRLGYETPMHIPRAPDLRAPRRLALTALVVGVGIGTFLGFQDWRSLAVTLGDTDDATRLVLVRGLLHGQGWWDQLMVRFQPPVGVYMHWSRLLDGAIAALDWLLHQLLAGPVAETVTRFIWPLLLIFPAALAVLMIARSLGEDRTGQELMGGAAVFAAAVVLLLDLPLYTSQFHPGRIDHHNAQMTLCLLSLAGACLSRREIKGAILAGAATGLGVAIGLEALIFEAAIGAGFAIGFLVDVKERRAAAAYGLTLASVMLAAFAIQTPPWRWSVVACDALALNLVAGLSVAGFGLAAIAALSADRPQWVRLASMAILGAVTAGVYLGLDPDCRHGFFADIDPRIRPIWLNYVNEVRPIQWFWSHDQALAVTVATPWIVGAIAWIGIGLKRTRRTHGFWLIGVLLAMAIAAGASAVRMSGYAEWFAAPLAAVAVLIPARRYAAGGVVTVLIAAAAGTPSIAAALASQADKLIVHKTPAKAAPKPNRPNTAAAKPAAGKARPAPTDHCFETSAYKVFATATPPGLVLSEVDLGPFILAHTDNSALAAPYHRMSWGIMRAHTILAAPADHGAEALARQAGVAYVLECQFHARHGDRSGMTKDSLQKRLDAGTPPAWLQPLSLPWTPLQAYRVAPQSAGKAPNAPQPLLRGRT